jgi:hypothetical protein
MVRDRRADRCRLGGGCVSAASGGDLHGAARSSTRWSLEVLSPQTIRAPGYGKYELQCAVVSAGPSGAGLTSTIGKGDGLGFENRLSELQDNGSLGTGSPIDGSAGGPSENGHSFEASLPGDGGDVDTEPRESGNRVSAK